MQHVSELVETHWLMGEKSRLAGHLRQYSYKSGESPLLINSLIFRSATSSRILMTVVCILVGWVVRRRSVCHNFLS